MSKPLVLQVKSVLLCVLLLFWGGAAAAAEVIVGEAIYHDTSTAVVSKSASKSKTATSTTEATAAKATKKEIPIRPRDKFGRFPDLAEPDGASAAASKSKSAMAAQLMAPTPAPLVSKAGLSEQDNRNTVGFSVVPPDINGDIGFDQSGNRIFIQYINSIWAVFDVNGNRIHGPFAGNSFWAGFGGYCQNNNDGDPVVLYDDYAGRWFFSQFSINQGVQCVAVSTTSNPLGPYHRYAFVVTPGGSNDYPKLGVWADGSSGSAGQSAYTFTLRDFGGSGGSFSVSAGVMERDKMLIGAAAKFVKFSNPCTGTNCMEGQLPPHLDGPTPPAGTCPTFWAAVDAAYDDSPFANDGYRNHSLCVNWANTAASTYIEGPLVAAGSNFDRFLGNGFGACISPVRNGESLDCLANFTMYRAQYRWFGSYGSVVVNSTVDAGSDRAGIRWAELRSNDGDTAWYRQQDGTFAPADGLERWMGSIAQDGSGNIALGYSVAGSALFPAIRYTSRAAGDPAGTMPGGEVSCVEGTGAQTSSGSRWGDYSSMSVDPSDDCTFWYTQEYYEVTGSYDFNTRICSFKLAGCGGPVVVDQEAPGVPPALQLTGATSDSISMAWSASVDNVGVAGYEVFRNGSLFATVATTSYTNSGLTPNTSHGYQVRAYDAAGNRSDLTATVTGTTTAIPPDVITLVSASYNSGTSEFKVVATSSKQPNVSLQVQGFGPMTYKTNKYEYKLKPVGNITIPQQVTITSSLGASLTVNVAGAPVPQPPGLATNPGPANGASSVATNAVLSWTAGSGATSHNVYFGTSSNPPSVSTGQSGTSFNPGTLAQSTTYYWRVDGVNAVGTRTGTAWSFTTVGAAPVDAVTISKAEWSSSKKELKVEATSNGTPAPVLTVVGFGAMTYDSNKKKYSLTLKPVNTNPGTITVTSSKGGSASKAVTVR